MSQPTNNGFFANIKSDLSASVVVFLVALPLCLGIALGSGAPLFSGIIAGIVGGILVGLLSGSPLGVSGPAAGLIAIVVVAIKDLGFETFLLAVVFAGILQVIFGLIKAGILGYYFPNAVIKGMLTGIGITIILKQFPHSLGYDKIPEGVFAFFQGDGETTISELINMWNFFSPGALTITLVSLGILILWEQKFIKRMSFTKVIQGPLVAVAAGIGLNVLFQGTDLAVTGTQLVNIDTGETLDDFLALFKQPEWSSWNNPSVYVVGLTLAVVASLETLLCVEATDKLDPQKRVTPTNRELLAQGGGNIVSGLIGGLPITQVIVRSSANIQSGGKTKASAVIHGFLLLICAASIPFVLNMIPYGSLAAVLFMVGYKLAKPSLFKQMYRMGIAQFVPFLITVLGIVFTDLLIGIGLGLVVAIAQILWNNYRTPYHFEESDAGKDKPIRIQLAEDVSFLNKAGMLRTLNQIPDGVTVILDASKTRTIHPDVLEIFADFEQNAQTRDIKLQLVDLKLHDQGDPMKEFGRFIVEHPSSS